MKKKKVVDPRYARKGEYKDVIETIDKEGKCPFCLDNFKYHKHSILHFHGNWFATKISWPYENAEYHFVLIPREHKENLSEFNLDDLISIRFLIKWIGERYPIKGGAIAMRFGETFYTGATVCHLHVHLIVPQKGKTVNFPIG